MKRTFIETSLFSDKIRSYRDNNLLKNIQDEILKNPEKGVIVPGTAGVRKIRISDKKHGRGKSGSFRVFYFDNPIHMKTYLIVLYMKKEQEDISQEDKKIIKTLVSRLKEY